METRSGRRAKSFYPEFDHQAMEGHSFTASKQEFLIKAKQIIILFVFFFSPNKPFALLRQNKLLLVHFIRVIKGSQQSVSGMWNAGSTTSRNTKVLLELASLFRGC